jgi:hypothetical protein
MHLRLYQMHSFKGLIEKILFISWNNYQHENSFSQNTPWPSHQTQSKGVKFNFIGGRCVGLLLSWSDRKRRF